MHSVCHALKLDEFICVPTLQALHVTIAHMYIAMAMLKRYIVQPYCHVILPACIFLL